MNRTEKNWISFACGVAYVLCYLFLPFYMAVVSPITGLALMNYTSAIMIVPVVLGFLMMLSSLLMDAKISVYIGGASVLVTMIFLFFGKNLATSGGLTGVAVNAASELVGMDIGSLLSVAVSPGLGGIACVLLCVAHLVFELVQGSRKPIIVHEDDDFFS